MEQTHMARMEDLERDNPNFRSQYSEWRQQRTQNNEDANDYQAFRAHLQGIGAPDPGEEQFEEFGSDAESMVDSQPMGASGTAGSGSNA
jgi:hypothetical protein